MIQLLSKYERCRYLNVLRSVAHRLRLKRIELLVDGGPVQEEAAHCPDHVQEPEEDVDNGRVSSPTHNLVINLQNKWINAGRDDQLNY